MRIRKVWWVGEWGKCIFEVEVLGEDIGKEVIWRNEVFCGMDL